MKYLVNRKTKEHRIDRCPEAELSAGWYRVEADAEGWIEWEGGERPLPASARVDVRLDTGEILTDAQALAYYWGHSEHIISIVAYRPILDKPEATAKESLTVEQEPPQGSRGSYRSLIDELAQAHWYAQLIPDIEAQLREELGKMGYDLVARDPFVERTDYEKDVAESAPASETTKEEHVRVAQEPTARKTEIVFSSAPQSVRYGEGMMVADITVTNDETMTVVCHESVNDQVANMLYHGLNRHEFIAADPTEDMSDWRNWREGDLVVLQDFAPEGYYFKRGKTYRVRHVSDRGYTIQASSMHDISICRRNNDFRFHSRPEESK